MNSTQTVKRTPFYALHAAAGAKLIDFGFATSAGTRDSTLIGTNLAARHTFASPEQIGLFSGRVDSRSDIYSLGATVYALLTGRPPFEGDSLPQTIEKIRQAEPIRPKKYQLAIPELFEGTVLKMLAKRPDERYQKASDLVSELERVARFQGMSL